MSPIHILHFSDVLCVWAYIAQVRVDELKKNFPDEVSFEFRYVQVFGDVRTKLETQWADRGGAEGYSKHVAEVATPFDHVAINPAVWSKAIPVSSMPAHLLLCAVRLFASEEDNGGGAHDGLLDNTAWAIRRAFFQDLTDISKRMQLLEIVEQIGLPVARIEGILDSGAAHAQLSSDFDLARDNNVKASPTMIFNEGRQRLTGNVGYRVLEANIREAIRAPNGQQSWC